jgi:hypothetical protein
MNSLQPGHTVKRGGKRLVHSLWVLGQRQSRGSAFKGGYGSKSDEPGPPSERLELGVNRTSWPEKQTWPIEGPLSGEERTLFVRGCQDRF